MNNENPLIPMAVVTGRPERSSIHSFLRSFRDVGITQFLLYPRSGCEIEYLSDEWFDTCRIILDECRDLRYTSVWLYDEYNWPSGQCGGRIMKDNPDHALKILQVLEKDGEFSFATTSNPKRPDVLNPEAMSLFIKYTHDQYAKHFSQYFGTLIKGIFTDEPSFSYVGACSGNERLRMPYYPELEQDYKNLTGSSLRDDIIFCLRNKCRQFYRPFVDQLLGRRFMDAFIQPIRDWCDRHGILMTGHLLGETCVESSLRSSGCPMEASDAFSLPGMDEILTASEIHSTEWITLSTVEHAIRKNGKGGMAELFALGPCDMSFAKIRRQIRMVSLFGIDHYLLAMAPLDMRGNTSPGMKSQYFNCFSSAQPCFPALKALGNDALNAANAAHRQFIPEIQIRRPKEEADLQELLIQLVNAQRQWSLLGENEIGTAPVVLHLDQEGFSIEKMPNCSICKFISCAAFLSVLDKCLPRKTTVTEMDGSMAKDIFFRTYADGSCEIVNLSDSGKTRRLCLVRNGGNIPFELPQDGIKSIHGWKVQIDRPNLKRLIFDNGVCSFKLDCALDKLVLILRQRETPVALELDGMPICATESADALPDGFKPLYLSTKPMRLEAGMHSLKLIGDCPEYPFLPSAFLAGHFADFGNTIGAYTYNGEGLENYIGKIIQTATVQFPDNATSIALETDNLCTEIYLDNVKMPERIWAPFSWRIPEHLAGKAVPVRIERLTSCGPMFGDLNSIPKPPDENLNWLSSFRSTSGKVKHPIIEISFQ